MPPSAELIRIGFLASLVAGLATGAGALPVLFTRQVSDRILDVMPGFAAGAMLFVVCDEMIPESHRKGHERDATFGLMAGFVIMMVLDNIFG